jgi:hypothetical protein
VSDRCNGGCPEPGPDTADFIMCAGAARPREARLFDDPTLRRLDLLSFRCIGGAGGCLATGVGERFNNPWILDLVRNATFAGVLPTGVAGCGGAGGCSARGEALWGEPDAGRFFSFLFDDEDFDSFALPLPLSSFLEAISNMLIIG